MYEPHILTYYTINTKFHKKYTHLNNNMQLKKIHAILLMFVAVLKSLSIQALSFAK